MPRLLLPALALLTLTLAACGQSTPTATVPVNDPVLSNTQASVTLRLPAPQALSAQYINQSKTTSLDVSIDGNLATSYTLGSATAPCANGFCTVTLLNLSPGSHSFTFGTYGVKPADGTTVLISQGSLTATLLGGQSSTFSLTLTPVGTGLALSSAVKQYNATSKTFGNYVKFATTGGRSLPAYYDIQGVDSIGDVIPSTAAINAVVCGDNGTTTTNISDSTHANRFRVEVQSTGTHTLSVQAGTTCAAGGTALVSQTVTGTSPGWKRSLSATNSEHGLALNTTGTVQTWGSNASGQLGDGTTISRSTPIAVPNLTAIALSAGYRHSLALKSDGTVQAWGYNTYGQLGDGTTTNRSIPIAVPNLTGVVGLSGGVYNTMVLKSDGTVQAWGYNTNGQLGLGDTTTHPTPTTVPALTNIVGLAPGYMHSLALKSDGTVLSWGSNVYGQLGNGTTTQNITPIAVSGLNDVVQISAGIYHSLALRADGTVLAWGYNSNGQVGNGQTTNQLTPVAVSNLSGVTGVAAGYYHSLALKSDGTAAAWGANTAGQLGDGTTTQRTTPVAVQNLSGVAEINAGLQYSLALKADGTAASWGSDSFGQLGDGTTTQRTLPVAVLNVSGIAPSSP